MENRQTEAIELEDRASELEGLLREKTLENEVSPSDLSISLLFVCVCAYCVQIKLIDKSLMNLVGFPTF